MEAAGDSPPKRRAAVPRAGVGTQLPPEPCLGPQRRPFLQLPRILLYPRGRMFPVVLGTKMRHGGHRRLVSGTAPSGAPGRRRGDGGQRRPFGSNAASPTGRVRGRARGPRRSPRWGFPKRGAPQRLPGRAHPPVAGVAAARWNARPWSRRPSCRRRAASASRGPAAPGPGLHSNRERPPRAVPAGFGSASCSSSRASGHLRRLPHREVQGPLRGAEGPRPPRNREWPLFPSVPCGLLKSQNFVSLTTPGLAGFAGAQEMLPDRCRAEKREKRRASLYSVLFTIGSTLDGLFQGKLFKDLSQPKTASLPYRGCLRRKAVLKRTYKRSTSPPSKL